MFSFFRFHISVDVGLNHSLVCISTFRSIEDAPKERDEAGLKVAVG